MILKEKEKFGLDKVKENERDFRINQVLERKRE